MPTIAEIRKNYPQYSDMSDEQLADGLYRKFYSDLPREDFNARIGLGAPAPVDQKKEASQNAKDLRDEYYSSGIYAGEYNPLGSIARSIDALASGAQRAPLMGWDDEAAAAVKTLGGTAGDYEKARQQANALKNEQRQSNPVASTVGEIAGGLAAGGTVAATGATLAGRSIPLIGRTGGAALEGGAYGALSGAGEADPGQRGVGAAVGAAFGAPLGAAASKVGDWVASRAARNAAIEAAPTVDELAQQSSALYQQARDANISIKPDAWDKVADNMTFSAGRLNRDLRPKTAGIVEDVQALKGQPIDLQQMDELRQTINQSLKTAEDQDARTLMRMKEQLDGFADRATPEDITGNVDGFNYLKEARDLWRRKSKADALTTMMDLADVNSAKYTQSGEANSIKLKAKELYTRIAKGQEKGFSAEETALIRQLSKGEMTPKAVEWVAKFAPRGVVSTGTGSAVGGMLGSFFGPVGTAIGMAAPGAVGHGAAKIADRAASNGLNALRAAAASDTAPVVNAITNKTVPFIGGLSSETANQLVRTRR